MISFYSATTEEVFQSFSSGPAGLSGKEAESRLLKYGPNELPEKRRVVPFFIFLRQFKSVFIYILLGAAFLAFVFNQLLDVYVILAVVVLNAVIGFFEETKAENAIQGLKKLLMSFAKVMRAGELRKLPARTLVPGDVIFLEEGDRVPADARLLEAKYLKINEASLTGESLPAEKSEKILSGELAMADQKNMVWMGTGVVAGVGKAVVVATGEETVIGEIAESLEAVRTEISHFEKKTGELAWQMGAIAVFGALLTFVVGFFVRRLEFFEILIFSSASLVSGIPEGLPAVLAIVLAVGVRRMAARGAIVRRLSAVETLGVASVIATDKTGTITENSMMVERILLAGGGEIKVSGRGFEPVGSFLMDGEEITHPLKSGDLGKLIHIAAVCNNGRVLRSDGRFEIIGDPTEAALAVLGEKAGLPKDVVSETEEIADELPFDENRKYRAILLGGEQKEICMVGAFENIIDLSTHFLANGTIKEMTHGKRLETILSAEEMASLGMRVLALAFKREPKAGKLGPKALTGMTLAGLVGMSDPPRPEVKEAIAKARSAGIKVILKTGDHKNTAVAIAREIGLIDVEVKPEKVAVTEEELLDALKLGEKEFEETVGVMTIFARVTPQMKLRIVETLQKRGEIVVMTGDGVNDAPALKKADVGVAMGLIGTDVARETSEVVLTDDNFASIVSAIVEGRTVFTNVRHTSFYLVTTNFAEDVTIISSLLLAFPLPLLPIHVLWLNLITDGVPTAGLALEPSRENEIGARPRPAKEKILSWEILPYLLLTAALMVAGTLILYASYLPEGIMKARTVAFTAMAFFQLWNVFNMRSLKHSVFKIGFFSNKVVIYSFLAALALQVAVIEIPFLRQIFRFELLDLKEWLLIGAVSASVFIFGELYKRFKKQ